MSIAANRKFPVEVKSEAGYGRVVATQALKPGTAIAFFDGPVVAWSQVPSNEIRHAALLDGDRWLISKTDARFLNHSCDPNCTVLDSLEVVTLRPVQPHDELTISYDLVDAHEYLADPAAHFWDERWTFDCRCGSPLCVGRVDGYRVTGKARDWQAKDGASKIRAMPIPHKGRGVAASLPVRKGELLECAPILFLPSEQWPSLEKTAVYDYTFSWGKDYEHAALALGLCSIVNHSYRPNSLYRKNLEAQTIDIVALRDIGIGEEITINYNEDPEDGSPLWFEPVAE